VSPGPLTPIASPISSTTATLPPSTSLSNPTTTTTESGSGGTTATTTPLGTTSTSVASTWQVRTIPTDGGTVVVSYRPGQVVLDGATPAAGFKVEVEKQGPPEVRVKFENESKKVEVRVDWDGKLVTDVQVDGEGEED